MTMTMDDGRWTTTTTTMMLMLMLMLIKNYHEYYCITIHASVDGRHIQTLSIEYNHTSAQNFNVDVT